jgi:hypothetical protein
MKSVAALVGVVLGLAAAGRADAAPVLLEQPAADPTVAGTFFSDVDQPREAATPFALAEDASITSIVWWGGYFGVGSVPSVGTSDFVIRLYATDAFGGPAALPLQEVAVSTSVTSIPGAAVPSFQFEASLPASLDVMAGVPLWLAIVDVDPTRPTFAWRKSTESGSSFSRAGAGFAWDETPGFGSFRLEGTVVPEPGTAVLSLLGFSALGLGRRRRVPSASSFSETNR